MADNISPPGKITADKIRPSDIVSGDTSGKIKSQYAEIKRHRWHYLDAPAQGPEKATIFLIHGFPDLSLAWRYQIPLFTSLGLRCIALDCMGYGNTGTSSNIRDFSFKTHADAVAGIARAIGVHKAIIGGHDWGGLAVYRVAQWYPDLITHVFSVCTAYMPPTREYVSTQRLVETTIPQFGYQLQFGSEDGRVEGVVRDEKTMRNFLLGMYGGKPKSRKAFMTSEKGIDLDVLQRDEFAMTPLLDPEELDYYVQQFMKNGINGPCNWYRTRYVNWEEESKMPEEYKRVIQQPTLYILATRDSILTREMSKNMEKVVPNLTRGEVPATHWALWHTPDETNKILKEWVQGVVLGGKSKL